MVTLVVNHGYHGQDTKIFCEKVFAQNVMKRKELLEFFENSIGKFTFHGFEVGKNRRLSMAVSLQLIRVNCSACNAYVVHLLATRIWHSNWFISKLFACKLHRFLSSESYCLATLTAIIYLNSRVRWKSEGLCGTVVRTCEMSRQVCPGWKKCHDVLKFTWSF